jgi:precorrin-6A/cobalt-precorrin-6A reductase
VVDATHPFAATITANAASACRELALPHLVLARPAWPNGSAIVFGSDTMAAKVVAANGYSRVFLTTGRTGVGVFAGLDAWFLIRAVTPPDGAALPLRHQLLLSRGPYRYDDELNLLREYHIDALVTKNSGGDMTRAKVDAADALGVPVVMVDRPALPQGVATVDTVDDAAAWVRAGFRDA